MRWNPAAPLALSLALAVTLGACATGDGSSLFSKGPAGADTRVVLLEVIDENHATIAVGSAPIHMLESRTGVYEVVRAAGRNQVYVLVDATMDTRALAESVGTGYRGRVLSVRAPDAPEAR